MSGINQNDLNRWSEALAGIARTGLSFTESLYEQERFEEILNIATEIKVVANEDLFQDSDYDLNRQIITQEWLKSVGSGVSGYVTPKVAIGAVVGNDKGELLLIKRSDSGVWLYPTGWADIGYSPAEVVVKEVKEETGIEVEPTRLIAVLDGLRLGFTRVPLYSLVFQCKVLGGELRPHPLECQEVGWFRKDAMPEPLAGHGKWIDMVFKAINNEDLDPVFDLPRTPVWRDDLKGPN